MENKSFSKWAKEISEQEYSGMLCPNCLTRLRVRVTEELIQRPNTCAKLTIEQWETYKDEAHKQIHKHHPRKNYIYVCECPVVRKFYVN